MAHPCLSLVCTLTGWPPLAWLVIDGKHLTKPPKDWHPPAQEAGAGTAYIEVMQSAPAGLRARSGPLGVSCHTHLHCHRDRLRCIFTPDT